MGPVLIVLGQGFRHAYNDREEGDKELEVVEHVCCPEDLAYQQAARDGCDNRHLFQAFSISKSSFFLF